MDARQGSTGGVRQLGPSASPPSRTPTSPRFAGKHPMAERATQLGDAVALALELRTSVVGDDEALPALAAVARVAAGGVSLLAQRGARAGGRGAAELQPP